jgi:hypothetical protein
MTLELLVFQEFPWLSKLAKITMNVNRFQERIRVEEGS